jgi:hypothetical protein
VQVHDDPPSRSGTPGRRVGAARRWQAARGAAGSAFAASASYICLMTEAMLLACPGDSLGSALRWAMATSMWVSSAAAGDASGSDLAGRRAGARGKPGPPPCFTICCNGPELTGARGVTAARLAKHDPAVLAVDTAP